MIKYCPECGIKLEKEYKFCPNCGSDIGSIRKEKTDSSETVICKNCGEENPAGAYECSSCGVPLRKGKPERAKKVVDRKKTVPAGGANDRKSLDITKIIAIFAGVIGLALIVLIISGTFEDPVTEQNVPKQVESSGVDLSAIQQINDLEKKVQADPGNMELLLQLAHLKNDSGFYEKAVDDYTKYLEKNPSDADARIDMGVCYYNLKQYDAALKEMKKALEYRPGHQIGHLNIGIVNLAAGNVEEAKKWLQKAESINPNNDIGQRANELLKNH